MKKAYLLLEDGTKIEGTPFGADTDSAGEVVFNTGMMGYPESFTDPSYRGQILTLTYPLIGNYGVPGDCKDENGLKKYFESNAVHIKGLIVSEYCKAPSHWHSKKNIDEWLKKNNVPGLAEIDTRALTQKLRESGTMLGKIVTDPNSPIEFYNPDKDNVVAQVSVKKPITYKAGTKKVVLIDCGAKNNIVRSLLARNLTVIRVPWNYDFFANGIKPDGIFLSNGPGDPMFVTQTHEIVKKSIESGIPVFGICLGNQIMAIAAGAKTYKLKYGHRAQNQPCMDLETGKCYITSQNHGFAVNEKTLPKEFKTWFINVNDKTVEGIKHKTKPIMAVQFHPESTPGPTDTSYLFDKFADML
ncbi:carbamoyl-phosphate synthase (glutamine-hydrolyzing) small subunit [bacterium]|nr:carbamoyl-phosphate synthase (glutamine-hydrolyzing) small subunit [bacterium]